MKYYCIFILAVFISCKSSDGINDSSSNIRFDGFYMALNPFATANPDTINGVPVERNSFKLLRFYDLDSGVIIPTNMSKDFKMEGAEIDKHYLSCEQYEVKNPVDKHFVNFGYRLYGKDSIKFSQVAPNTRIDYVGKVYKDSIALSYVLTPIGVGIIPNLKPKPLHFKFYAKSN